MPEIDREDMQQFAVFGNSTAGYLYALLCQNFGQAAVTQWMARIFLADQLLDKCPNRGGRTGSTVLG